MRKIFASLALASTLFFFSLKTQKQPQSSFVPLQRHSQNFRTYRLKNSSPPIPQTTSALPPEDLLETHLQENFAFLRSIHYSFKDSTREEGATYAEAGKKLLEYCQTITDPFVFQKNLGLKVMFMETFLDLIKNTPLINRTRVYPGSEAFECATADSYDLEDLGRAALSEQCGYLDLGKSVELQCADTIRTYFNCFVPEEAEAWAYAQLILCRDSEEFTRNLEECYDRAIIRQAALELNDRYLLYLNQVPETLEDYLKEITPAEETDTISRATTPLLDYYDPTQ